jgi:hypothetical protein
MLIIEKTMSQASGYVSCEDVDVVVATVSGMGLKPDVRFRFTMTSRNR